MRRVDIVNSVGRVVAESGRVCGAALLLEDNYLLTCAHVVRNALPPSIKDETNPTAPITIDLLVGNKYQPVSARIVVGGWDEEGDIAVLTVDSDQLKSMGLTPLRLLAVRGISADLLWGDAISAYGFPVGTAETGLWSSGEILSELPNGWLQVSKTDDSEIFITQGFSGGPVWDDRLQRVIGIVTHTLARHKSAACVPAANIIERVPVLTDTTDVLDVIGEYREQLLARTEFTELTGIPFPEDRSGRILTPRIPLDDVYIQVKALPQDRVLSIETEERQQIEASSAAGYEVVDALGKKLLEPNEVLEDLERLEAVDPQVALEKHHRIVVLGEPGAGKTTMLRFIARRVAQTEADIVPIYVEVQRYLIRLSQDNGISLAQFAIQEVAGNNVELQQLLWRMSSSNQVLWLVDGLDDARDHRERVVEQCGMLQGTLILTSRVVGYKEGGQIAALPHYELLPLSSGSVEDFLQNWYRASNESAEAKNLLADTQVELILDRLSKQPRLRELTRNPLLLTFLIVIASKDSSGRLPEHRAELYHQYIEELLDSWETSKELPDPNTQKRELSIGPWKGTSARDVALSGFYHLGWFLHTAYFGVTDESAPDLNIEVVTNELATYFGEKYEELGLLASREAASDVMDFWQRAGMLVVWTLNTNSKRIPQRFVAFRHVTFQEYAAGRVLANKWKRDSDSAWLEILSKMYLSAWNEPILLAAGLLSSSERGVLLESFLRVDEPDNLKLPYTAYVRSKKARCRAVAGYLRREVLLSAAIIAENYSHVEEQYIQMTASRIAVLMRSDIPILAQEAARAAVRANDWVDRGPFSQALFADIERGRWDDAPYRKGIFGMPASAEVLYARMAVDPLPPGLLDMFFESIENSTSGLFWKILLLSQLRTPTPKIVDLLSQAFEIADNDRLRLEIAQSMAREGEFTDGTIRRLLQNIVREYNGVEPETLFAMKQLLREPTFPVEATSATVEGLVRLLMHRGEASNTIHDVLLVVLSNEQKNEEIARTGTKAMLGVPEEKEHFLDYSLSTRILGDLIAANDVHEAVFDVLKKGIDSEYGDKNENHQEDLHRKIMRVLSHAANSERPKGQVIQLLIDALNIPHWGAVAAEELAQASLSGSFSQDLVAQLNPLWQIAHSELLKQVFGEPFPPGYGYSVARISSSAVKIWVSLNDQGLLSRDPEVILAALPEIHKEWVKLTTEEIGWGIQQGFYEGWQRRFIEWLPNAKGRNRRGIIYVLSEAMRNDNALPECAEAILEAANDGDPEFAAPAFGGLGYAIAKGLVEETNGIRIIEGLQSEDRSVRYYAGEGLSAVVKSGRTIPTMVQSLEEVLLRSTGSKHRELLKPYGDLLEAGLGTPESLALLRKINTELERSLDASTSKRRDSLEPHDNFFEAVLSTPEVSELLNNDDTDIEHSLQTDMKQLSYTMLQAARGGLLDTDSARILRRSAMLHRFHRTLHVVEALGFAIDGGVADSEMIHFLQEKFKDTGGDSKSTPPMVVSAVCRACEILAVKDQALQALASMIRESSSWNEMSAFSNIDCETAFCFPEVKEAAFYLLDHNPRQEVVAALVGRIGQYQGLSATQANHFLATIFDNDVDPLSWIGRIEGMGYLLQGNRHPREVEISITEALLNIVASQWGSWDEIDVALSNAFVSAAIASEETVENLGVVLSRGANHDKDWQIAAIKVAEWINGRSEEDVRLLYGLIALLDEEKNDNKIQVHQRHVGELLGYVDDPAALDCLLLALRRTSTQGDFRWAQQGAALGLGHYGRRRPPYQPQILEAFNAAIHACERKPKVRESRIDSLTEHQSASDWTSFDNRDPSERRADAASVILEIERKEQQRVRIAIIEATGSMRSKKREASKIIADALRYYRPPRRIMYDFEGYVNTIALSAANGGYGSPEVVARILKLLETRSSNTRVVAWKALRDLADKEPVC